MTCKLSSVCGARALFVAASVSLMLQPSATADTDLLLLLEQKGYLSSQEVQELQASRALEVQSAADKAKAAPVDASAAGKNTVELKISGRFQFQYDGLSAQTKTAGVETSLPGTNKADFRRIFLGVSAKLKNNWYAQSVFDFARNGNGNGALLDYARVGWKPEKNLDLRLGYEKVPFGYETTTSSGSLLAIENAPAANYFSSVLRFNERHAGASVNGTFADDFAYSVMLANGAQGFNASGNGYSVWGRLRHTTHFEDMGVKLMVGADLGYQSENPTAAAGLNGVSIFGYNVYARADIGDLLVQGEFIGTSVEGTGGNERSSPHGAVVTAAYKIDKFQPVFQYSYLDSTNFAGGINPASVIRGAPTNTALLGSIAGPHRLDVYYLGLNYYIMGDDLKLSAGALYATAPANNGADGNGTAYEALGGRVQVQVQF